MRHLTILALVAVSACGSSSESFTFNGEEVTRAEFEELTGGGSLPSASDDPVSFGLMSLSDEIDASGLSNRANSSFNVVNTATGDATFTGVLDIATRGIPGREYNVLTETNITVDFDDDTLTSTFGEATVLNRSNEVVASPVANLTVSNGEIGGARPNAVAFDLSGNLTAQDFSVFVTGNLEGSLRGTPILGLTATDTSPVVIVDGVGSPSASITLEALTD